MNNFNFDTLEESVAIIEVMFEPIEWDESELKNLDMCIRVLEESFNQEIQSNIFGKTRLDKQDLIKIYINNIGEVLYNVIWVNYEDDEELNLTVFDRIKDFYQFLIDILCRISYQNNINLPNIIDENPVISNKINLGVYYSINRENILNSKTKIKVLESYFLNSESKDLFNHLVENFDSSYSSHNKFSCIYRLMIEDGFMDSNLKSENFKMIIKSVLKIDDINFSIKSKKELSSKIIKHYNHLKNTFMSE